MDIKLFTYLLQTVKDCSNQPSLISLLAFIVELFFHNKDLEFRFFWDYQQLRNIIWLVVYIRGMISCQEMLSRKKPERSRLIFSSFSAFPTGQSATIQQIQNRESRAEPPPHLKVSLHSPISGIQKDGKLRLSVSVHRVVSLHGRAVLWSIQYQRSTLPCRLTALSTLIERCQCCLPRDRGGGRDFKGAELKLYVPCSLSAIYMTAYTEMEQNKILTMASLTL